MSAAVDQWKSSLVRKITQTSSASRCPLSGRQASHVTGGGGGAAYAQTCTHTRTRTQTSVSASAPCHQSGVTGVGAAGHCRRPPDTDTRDTWRRGQRCHSARLARRAPTSPAPAQSDVKPSPRLTLQQLTLAFPALGGLLNLLVVAPGEFRFPCRYFPHQVEETLQQDSVTKQWY